MNNKKHYTVIVGSHYSISNDTDSDPMSDYSPGIWALSSFKSALKYALEYKNNGHTLKVTCYDNPQYMGVANKMITALGLDQPLFKLPPALPASVVTNGKPSNLSQLKKYLTPGLPIVIVNYDGDGKILRDRGTTVMAVQTNSIIVEKTLGSGSKSWLDIGKATDWVFTNDCAMKYYLRDSGYVLSTKIIYYN
jgi:hypothetical protein